MDSGIRWWVFILQLCLLNLAAATFSSNETDRLALLEFKSKISGDPLGVLSSWNDSAHFCRWFGVICSKRHARVTVLDVASQGISGSISPHIGNLTFLKELYLYNNTLRGAIPPEIGRLRRLQRLGLSNNSLGGEIPSNISRCSALVVLRVANNKLAGNLPRDLGFMYKLQYFGAAFNRLTGSIPPSFGNLSSIQALFIVENQLSGRIPEALGQLKKSLQRLGLQSNYLDGEIPASIFNLTFLTHLSFGLNRLRGNLPWNLGISLPNLEYFDMAYNELTGSLPASLSNTSNMVYLQLQGNNFTGSVPSMASSHNLQTFSIARNGLGSAKVNNGDDLSFLSSLTSARKLKVLLIDLNNFGSSLPEQMGNLSSILEILVLSTNQISKSIPDGLRNLINLKVFRANDNKLSGTTALSIIGDMPSLVDLSLENNNIAGSIPLSIGNLDRLLTLSMANNRLEGEIPAAIEDCKSLIFLDLSNNNLSGIIPPQILSLPSLSILLNLSNNHFTSVIPVEVGNLKNLGSLDFSHNMLSGSIPSSLGKCVILEFVFLQANLLQGPIPSTLDSLRGIKQFDVSSNNLYGQIPKFFEDMSSLQLLNISYNNFEGEAPAGGVLKNSSIISVIGNVKLCGGMAELNLPPCNFRQSKKTLSSKWKVLISAISSLAVLVSMAACLLVFWVKRKGKEHTVYGDGSNTRVSYQILHKATDGFSTTNLIGVGSFGSVYKGVLDNINGIETTIAVKVVHLQRRGASKSFMAECEALKNIRHRNLVRIVTVCSGVDYQGNDFKALIYEFVVNGSLENWLHPVLQGVDVAPRILNFRQRLNVVIDLASALDYIHNLCETPIAHCDLKPSNVLLDENMVAHLGDFGLARFLQSSVVNPSLTGQISSSIGIKGTVGYAPPEYGMGNEVSIQGDVYSYGILLLELFTGMRPTDDSFKDGLNIRSIVDVALSEQQPTLAEIVDPTLLNECHISEEAVISILQIGVDCSSDSSQYRPSISEVLPKLNKLLA